MKRRPWLTSDDQAMLVCTVACAVWCFLPTLRRLMVVWQSEPDYGHGFLVPVVAAGMLWMRRADRPAAASDWRALPLVVAALVMWIAGQTFYLAALQDFGFLLWVAAACWLLGGGSLLRWAAPALGFLLFMVPAPYRIEQLLTLPMQRLATSSSGWLLQCCGLPALAEGNVLVIDDVRVEVAQACSGLRLFISVLALAYLYAAFSQGPRWMKVTLLSSALPVSLVANALRLTATAIAWKCVATDQGRELVHHAAGWLMIPLAAALIHAVLWYLRRLTVEVEVVDATRLLRHRTDLKKLPHAVG